MVSPQVGMCLGLCMVVHAMYSCLVYYTGAVPAEHYSVKKRPVRGVSNVHDMCCNSGVPGLPEEGQHVLPGTEERIVLTYPLHYPPINVCHTLGSLVKLPKSEVSRHDSSWPSRESGRTLRIWSLCKCHCLVKYWQLKIRPETSSNPYQSQSWQRKGKGCLQLQIY